MAFRSSSVLLVLLISAAPAAAQPGAGDATPQQSAPAIRRWFDLQTVYITSRFRWVKSNDGRITSSTHQWQPLVRGRFLLDEQARYTVNVTAQSGSHFVSGWNNSGGGMGDFAGDFSLKQLFLAAAPTQALEIQIGGLPMLRGENTDITTYDSDAYLVGERIAVRRSSGPVAQVVATAGHIGDYRTPNVFRRLDALADVNYGQLLIGARLAPRVTASADYTYEDGRDFVREGLTLRLPSAARVLRSLKLDAYHRLSDPAGHGFNVSGELRFTSRFTATAGVTHIDRDYLIPGYMSPNADRYERGTRFYSQGNYQLTREWSVGWFHGEAFNVDYVIPNEHRWEVLVTFNPTAALKARGIF